MMEDLSHADKLYTLYCVLNNPHYVGQTQQEFELLTGAKFSCLPDVISNDRSNSNGAQTSASSMISGLASSQTVEIISRLVKAEGYQRNQVITLGQPVTLPVIHHGGFSSQCPLDDLCIRLEVLSSVLLIMTDTRYETRDDINLLLNAIKTLLICPGACKRLSSQCLESLRNLAVRLGSLKNSDDYDVSNLSLFDLVAVESPVVIRYGMIGYEEAFYDILNKFAENPLDFTNLQKLEVCQDVICLPSHFTKLLAHLNPFLSGIKDLRIRAGYFDICQYCFKQNITSAERSLVFASQLETFGIVKLETIYPNFNEELNNILNRFVIRADGTVPAEEREKIGRDIGWLAMVSAKTVLWRCFKLMLENRRSITVLTEALSQFIPLCRNKGADDSCCLLVQGLKRILDMNLLIKPITEENYFDMVSGFTKYGALPVSEFIDIVVFPAFGKKNAASSFVVNASVPLRLMNSLLSSYVEYNCKPESLKSVNLPRLCIILLNTQIEASNLNKLKDKVNLAFEMQECSLRTLELLASCCSISGDVKLDDGQYKAIWRAVHRLDDGRQLWALKIFFATKFAKILKKNNSSETFRPRIEIPKCLCRALKLEHCYDSFQCCQNCDEKATASGPDCGCIFDKCVRLWRFDDSLMLAENEELDWSTIIDHYNSNEYVRAVFASLLYVHLPYCSDLVWRRLYVNISHILESVDLPLSPNLFQFVSTAMIRATREAEPIVFMNKALLLMYVEKSSDDTTHVDAVLRQRVLTCFCNFVKNKFNEFIDHNKKTCKPKDVVPVISAFFQSIIVAVCNLSTAMLAASNRDPFSNGDSISILKHGTFDDEWMLKELLKDILEIATSNANLVAKTEVEKLMKVVKNINFQDSNFEKQCATKMQTLIK